MNGDNRSFRYHAFLSYSQRADSELADAIQRGLEKFAKPWNERRALRIFKDDSALALNESLWGRIQESLDSSEWLVLLASPQAKKSEWVNREVAHWLAGKDPNAKAKVLLVLTDGEIVWDHSNKSYDPDLSTALPHLLAERSADDLPLYLDVRWYRDVEEEGRSVALDLRNPRFRDAIASIGAAIREVDKDELDSGAVRQERQSRLVRNLALVSLTALALLTTIFGVQSNTNARTAASERAASIQARDDAIEQEQRANAEASKALAASRSATARADEATLLAVSASLTDSNPALALAVAGEALGVRGTYESIAIETRARAYEALATNGQPIGDVFVDHEGTAVRSVAFSPDATALASAGDDGTVRLWNVETGQPIGEPLQGHKDGVTSVAFDRTGNVLASGGGDGTVRLWNVETGQPIGQPLEGHGSPITSVAFSPTDALLATSSGDLTNRADNTVRFWDSDTGSPIGEPLLGHEDWLLSIAFSKDGSIIASASIFGSVGLWNPRTQERIVPQRILEPATLLSMALSPSGDTIATSSQDDTIRLWDAKTGQPIGEPLTDHDDWVLSMAFSPDGTILASAGSDQTIRLQDSRTGQPVGQPLVGHEGRIWSLAFGPESTLLASGGDDGTVRLWDVEPNQPFGQQLADHENLLTSVALSPDGTTVASSSVGPDGSVPLYDSVIRLWDVETGELIGQPLAVGASDDGSVAEPFSNVRGVLSLTFDPEGKTLASGHSEGTIWLWHPESGEHIGDPLVGHESSVQSVAFSPDGTILASASDDETIRLWDPQTGTQIGQPLTGHDGEIRAVAFSFDGQTVASGGTDGTIRLWDAESGDQKGPPIGHLDGQLLSLAFSPRGGLASGGSDNMVRLWDVETGLAKGPPLGGHRGPVASVTFSADGMILASGSQTGRIRVWDPTLAATACWRAQRYVTEAQLEAALPAPSQIAVCTNLLDRLPSIDLDYGSR